MSTESSNNNSVIISLAGCTINLPNLESFDCNGVEIPFNKNTNNMMAQFKEMMRKLEEERAMLNEDLKKWKEEITSKQNDIYKMVAAEKQEAEQAKDIELLKKQNTEAQYEILQQRLKKLEEELKLSNEKRMQVQEELKKWTNEVQLLHVQIDKMLMTGKQSSNNENTDQNLNNINQQLLDLIEYMKKRMKSLEDEKESYEEKTNLDSHKEDQDQARRESGDGNSGDSGQKRSPPANPDLTDPRTRFKQLFEQTRGSGSKPRCTFTWPYPGVMHATLADRVEVFNIKDIV